MAIVVETPPLLSYSTRRTVSLFLRYRDSVAAVVAALRLMIVPIALLISLASMHFVLHPFHHVVYVHLTAGDDTHYLHCCAALGTCSSVGRMYQ
jgi:hypothetical protein